MAINTTQAQTQRRKHLSTENGIATAIQNCNNNNKVSITQNANNNGTVNVLQNSSSDHHSFRSQILTTMIQLGWSKILTILQLSPRHEGDNNVLSLVYLSQFKANVIFLYIFNDYIKHWRCITRVVFDIHET